MGINPPTNIDDLKTIHALILKGKEKSSRSEGLSIIKTGKGKINEVNLSGSTELNHLNFKGFFVV